MKILNLYAGIGGNRKHWEGDIVAVERDPRIADVYGRLYPDDDLIIADAHEYLLQNFKKFDFIWSSPPCQSHSRMILSGRNRKPRYPQMDIYQQILLLKHQFKSMWVVENVKPYYKPLIPPSAVIGRHYFWSNFYIGPVEVPEFKDFINRQNLAAKDALMDWLGIHYEENIYYEGNHCPTQVLRNCVHPIIGESVFWDAMYHGGLYDLKGASDFWGIPTKHDAQE